MPAIGANLQAHNRSFLTQVFCRKLGMKPRNRGLFGPTSLYNMAADTGATFPRQVAILAKVSVTAPTTNTAADCPTGKGDICLLFKAGNTGVAHIDVAQIDVYRCTAYTNTTTFTWAQIA